MGSYEIAFDQPWYLLLLVLIPAVWIISRRSISGLGKTRWMIACFLRSMALLGIIAALSEIQMLNKSEKVTVIYCLDQSASIPGDLRREMVDYVVREVNEHRDEGREDRASVIVFGRQAKIEVAPIDDDLPIYSDVETVNLETDATNLESALKLAKASFPEDSARRIVVVTDGNENLGDAATTARSLSDDGIGIDVIPIFLKGGNEVIVEKVALPSDIRRGQNFEARIVINNYVEEENAANGGVVPGVVKLFEITKESERSVGNLRVDLQPGKNVFPVRLKIDRAAIYRYRAEFEPDDSSSDQIATNNVATSFTHVRGKGRVLLIEDWESTGSFDFLVDRLRKMNIEVETMQSNNLFTGGEELLEYDSVVLANVPRTSGSSISDTDDPLETQDTTTGFSDAQIKMLVKNTEELGCGLIMIGGENSFGAGGWSNTELEKAMPVDFQIRNKKIQAVGALVMVMHASEFQNGNYWQKVIGIEAIKTLGPMDYCGVVQYGGGLGGDTWLWKKPLGLDRVYGNKKMMMQRVSRMIPGDMPDFDSSMKLALSGFAKNPASVKHMIIISDGDPTPPAPGLMSQFVKLKVQISTVAVGTHGSPMAVPLRNIANQTGGSFYVVKNPKALPRIYQREARKVSRPLIYEPAGGVNVLSNDVSSITGITEGIDVESLQRLKGYVLTTIKDSPLVEQVLVADKPGSEFGNQNENTTLLATWRYGLGRATVFTSDAGFRWANAWTDEEYYDKFFSQLVRHSMRPINENANFSMATEVKDGKVKVVVTALDENDEFLNFLNMNGRVITPELGSTGLTLRQQSSGRYVGEFEAGKSGSYLFTIIPGDDYESLRGGVNVPYSSEYNDRETNESLIFTLANLKPNGGTEGKVIEGDFTSQKGIDEVLETHDTFRQGLMKAISSQGIWPLVLVICAALFFADVFVRRVSIGFDWFFVLVAKARTLMFGDQTSQVEESSQMERLRQKKAQVNQELDERRSSTRFEPEPDELNPARSAEEILSEATDTRRRESTSTQPQQQITPTEDDSYTARLLRAKKQAKRENDRDN